MVACDLQMISNRKFFSEISTEAAAIDTLWTFEIDVETFDRGYGFPDSERIDQHFAGHLKAWRGASELDQTNDDLDCLC